MKHWSDIVNQLNRENCAYVLITILGLRGSTPRDSGTKMIITAQQTFATIGGGKLEFMVIEKAREMLEQASSHQHLEYYPLGPKLGQCCGGSTTILFEHFAQSHPDVMLFGAGHVGQALNKIIADLPIKLHWVDNRVEQFSDIDTQDDPGTTNVIVSANPVNEIAQMPAGAYYLVMTHDHQLDFELCCSILQRDDAAYIGLIGSQTKWRRFNMRLLAEGFSTHQIEQINCPVGLSNVPGKRPMEVAVSIAGSIISEYHKNKSGESNASQQGVQWKQLKNLQLVSNKESPDSVKASLENQRKDCGGCNECK